MTTYTDIVAEANAQTDQYNSWDSWGEDEKVEFAFSCGRDSAPKPSGWIVVEDGLPKEIIVDGAVNCVLAKWKEDRMDGAIPNPNICNVTYFNSHAEQFTHWMYVPEIQQ